MNKDKFSGKWHELKGKIREKWGKLTNDDLAQINGNYEQFLGKVQQRYGYEKERAEREIHQWMKANCESCGSCDDRPGQKEHPRREGDQENPSRQQNRKNSDGESEQNFWKGDDESPKGPDKGKNDKKRKAG